MTANQIFGSVQALPCTHTLIIPGLDSIQCKNCRRTWPSWHSDFNRLLNQSQVTPEQKQNCSGVDFTVTPEQKHWLETYSPSNRKNYSYYRYVWMDGQKMHHVHLPGGNTGSVRSSARATEVERWLALGRSPQQIHDLIKSWRSSNYGSTNE